MEYNEDGRNRNNRSGIYGISVCRTWIHDCNGKKEGELMSATFIFGFLGGLSFGLFVCFWGLIALALRASKKEVEKDETA